MKKDGKVVSFINMKGGVGKTTLCIGIGEYLAHYVRQHNNPENKKDNGDAGK